MWNTGPLPWITALTVVLCPPSPTASTADRPRPTGRLVDRGPTTDARLSEYAKGLELDRSAVGAGAGLIIITTDTVGSVGDDGELTVGTVLPRPISDHPDRLNTGGRDGENLEQIWRTKVLRQKDRVEKVRSDMVLEEARIRVLEKTAVRGRDGAARREARLAEARARRSVLADQLETERARLGAMIRHARRDGADPGWFR